MADIILPGLVQLDNKYRSINIQIPDTTDTEYLFGSEYLPSETELGSKAYWPDVRSKAIVQNWNSSYPGLEWEQQFYAYGMSGPVLYEIVQAPTGMGFVGGRLTRNPVTGFFDYQSAVLTWENPVAGKYRIGIRATDQIGQKVYWIFDHFSDAARNFFMALNATGNGSGSSPSNYASYAATIPHPTSNTVSACVNKVLRIKGDEFSSLLGVTADITKVSASWVNMPGEQPTFLQKFNVTSDNISLTGLRWEGVATDEFGIVGGYGLVNNFGISNCEFDECYALNTEDNQNQSCIGFSGSGSGYGRQRIFMSDSTFKNIETLHGYDVYDLNDHVFCNNELIINNGSTHMKPSWIFPKFQANGGEIMHNVADVPTLLTGDTAVVQLHNGWDVNFPLSYDIKQRCEYNYVRTGGLNCLHSHSAASNSPAPSNCDNFIKRNTLVGGFAVNSYVTTGNPNRRTFLESNVIIDSGGVPVPPDSSSWYIESGINVYATSATGVVDSSGALVSPTNWGKSGHKIWRPE